MTDFLLQTGMSNAVFSLGLAVLAVAAAVITRRPQVSYLLWLLVFVKLLTPPLLSMPVELASWQSLAGSAAQLTMPAVDTGAEFMPSAELAPGTPLPEQLFAQTGTTTMISSVLAWVSTWVVPVLLLGSLLGLCWSLAHVIRFNRMLSRDALEAPRELQVAAEDIARRLDLARVPVVYTTAARLSPMVWWVKGRISVIIPEQLLDVMEIRQWQWILAHEIAHIRRRDYLVRWLEWLGVILFWWNPVAWWAQRNLRATEEICCDALVLASLNPKPRTYAKSLLSVVEFLAYPALRPPAMASEINGGGFFLRRCKMIVTEQPKRFNQRWIQFIVLLVAVVVLPLGAHLYAKDKPEPKEPMAAKEKVVAGEYENSAQEYLDQVWEKLSAEVEAGNLTKDEANARHEMVKMSVHVMNCEAAMYKAQQQMMQKEMELAIASGKITPKEAKAKLKAVFDKEGEGMDKREAADAKMIKGWDKLTVLLDEGMITFEHAAEEYLILKQEAYPETKLDTNVADALAKYQEAVKTGKMTHAEAYDRLRFIDMAYYSKRLNQAEQKYFEEATWISLQTAVANGEMTKEEAEKKMQAWKAEQEYEVQEGEKPPSKTPKEGEAPPKKTPKEGEAPPKKPLKGGE